MMGDASVVLTAMQCGTEYRVDELSAITNLSKDRVRVVLNMAVRGGLGRSQHGGAVQAQQDVQVAADGA